MFEKEFSDCQVRMHAYMVVGGGGRKMIFGKWGGGQVLQHRRPAALDLQMETEEQVRRYIWERKVKDSSGSWEEKVKWRKQHGNCNCCYGPVSRFSNLRFYCFVSFFKLIEFVHKEGMAQYDGRVKFGVSRAKVKSYYNGFDQKEPVYPTLFPLSPGQTRVPEAIV